MSDCQHPAVAQTFDRIRGTVTCSLCGEVVNDQQFELDPTFNRGEKPAGGRPPPGYARPMRSTLLSNPATHRPSIDNARRSMLAISRQLEISQDDSEKAVAIFKLAVNNNVISGSRPSVLCACLYAVCRRANTPHTIFDFADATKETPFSILSHLKLICRATNTQLPSPDPTFYVHRLAQLLNLGDKTEEISILSVKILRAMNAEWLGYGRRPLGLCGAAVLVAANAFGVQRSVDDVVNFVRLSPETILLRMSEFLKTDAASLANIDDYKPSTTALPPALSRKPNHDWVYESSMRHLAQLYYELLNEARQSAPATEERKARWKEFIVLHCKLHNIEVTEEVMDLVTLSPAEQLLILGVKDTVIANPDDIRDVQEMESTRLIVSATAAALGVVAPPPLVATPSQSMARGDSCSGNNMLFDATSGGGNTDDFFSSGAFGSTGENNNSNNHYNTSNNSTSNDVFDANSFDNLWSSMAPQGNGMGGGVNDYGEDDDEFAFGGGMSAPNPQQPSWSQNGKIEMMSQNAKVEGFNGGVKSEAFSSQINNVQTMLQRFEQLRQLNSDVTTHVANVVSKANFEIIVLPSVEVDFGFRKHLISKFDNSVNDVTAVVKQAPLDPFADAETLDTVKVKAEPTNTQMGFDGTNTSSQINALEDPFATHQQQPVVVISELLTTSKGLTSTSAIGVESPNLNYSAVGPATATTRQRLTPPLATPSTLTSQLAPDLQMYIIQDLEVRMRLEAAGKKVFGDKWDAGVAKGDDEVLQAEIRACLAHGEETAEIGADGKPTDVAPGHLRARRLTKIRKHATAAAAIKESLRNKGASQIDVSAIFGDEDGGKNADFDINEMSEGDDDNGAGVWDD